VRDDCSVNCRKRGHLGTAIAPTYLEEAIQVKLSLDILASAEPHPNRRPFTGVLTYIDRPSEEAPSGARNHRVIITKRAAESALGTLIGMGIGYAPGFDGHDAQRKFGIITDAELVDDRIDVAGYVFARDFPEFPRTYDKRPHSWGMSYELADAHIEDMRAKLWTIYKLTFTGAAILLRDKGAYKATKFELG
jgi:hypothetical protein